MSNIPNPVCRQEEEFTAGQLHLVGERSNSGSPPPEQERFAEAQSVSHLGTCCQSPCRCVSPTSVPNAAYPRPLEWNVTIPLFAFFHVIPSFPVNLRTLIFESH